MRSARARAALVVALAHLVPSVAYAHGVSDFFEAFAYTRVLGPLGAVLTLVCATLTVLARRGAGRGVRKVLRVVAILTVGLAVLLGALGLYIGFTGIDWLDWPAIYLLSALVPAGAGALGLAAAGAWSPSAEA